MKRPFEIEAKEDISQKRVKYQDSPTSVLYAHRHSSPRSAIEHWISLIEQPHPDAIKMAMRERPEDERTDTPFRGVELSRLSLDFVLAPGDDAENTARTDRRDYVQTQTTRSRNSSPTKRARVDDIMYQDSASYASQSTFSSGRRTRSEMTFRSSLTRTSSSSKTSRSNRSPTKQTPKPVEIPVTIHHMSNFLGLNKGLPPEVKRVWRLLDPDILCQGSLPVAMQDTLEHAYPDANFPGYWFKEETLDASALVDRADKLYTRTVECITDSRLEDEWSSQVVLPAFTSCSEAQVGDSSDTLKVVLVTNRAVDINSLPAGTPNLKVDLIIEANDVKLNSALFRARQIRPAPDVLYGLDNSLSPFYHASSRFRPLYALVEIKSSAGSYQEAQSQAVVAGSAALRKARKMGATVDDIPCVPLVIVTGHRWDLLLLFDIENHADPFVAAGPFAIGSSASFTGALKITLFLDALWRYGETVWWERFCEGVCGNLFELD